MNVPETKTETAITKQKTKTVKMKIIKSILELSHQDHKRSEDMRRMCNIQYIVKWCRTRKRNGATTWTEWKRKDFPAFIKMDDHRERDLLVAHEINMELKIFIYRTTKGYAIKKFS